MFEKRICSKGGKATRIDDKKVEERKVKVPSLLVHILEKVKVSIRLVHILEMIFSLQFFSSVYMVQGKFGPGRLGPRDFLR